MPRAAPILPRMIHRDEFRQSSDWMGRLARHYEWMRDTHPDYRLMIVFDIDGTILDMRQPILRLLREYDRTHDTQWFHDVGLADIHEHENRIDDLLERLGVDPHERPRFRGFYDSRLWRPSTMLDAHRPFQGVLEVIRWFQIQPRTAVGLNTGRPESLRVETLRALNALAFEWKVQFSTKLLAMNRGSAGSSVRDAKIRGLRELQQAGYRIFAYVDNEPENLAAAAGIDPEGEILLLHADTIFESRRDTLPNSAVSGRTYELRSLVRDRTLPSHIELVWRGVNDSARLQEFLASRIRWAEVDVRIDLATDSLVVHPDPIDPGAPLSGRRALALDEVLEAIVEEGRGIKLSLREGGGIVDRLLARIDHHGFECEDLWFSSEIETLSEKGFRDLRARYPRSVIDCPIDFLAPMLESLPYRARQVVDEMASWGIDRFSLGWSQPHLSRAMDRLAQWGYASNLHGVPDLEAFLRAAILLPRSITCDFDLADEAARGKLRPPDPAQR